MSTFELERLDSGDGRVVHVALAGELDLTNAAEVEEALAALPIDAESVVLLDLNRVVFVDSAALHLLFRTARRLGRSRLAIACAPGAPIARTLQIVGLDSAAAVEGSVENALRSLDAA